MSQAAAICFTVHRQDACHVAGDRDRHKRTGVEAGGIDERETFGVGEAVVFDQHRLRSLPTMPSRWRA